MDHYKMTRNQVFCDICGSLQLRGLHFRQDFEDSVRMCTPCVEIHDQHPKVISERERHSWEEEMGDDF